MAADGLKDMRDIHAIPCIFVWNKSTVLWIFPKCPGTLEQLIMEPGAHMGRNARTVYGLFDN